MSNDRGWKTIDTISAQVPTPDGDVWTEFNVRFYRDAGNHRGKPRLTAEDPEQFSIENVALGIRVEAATLQQCKAQLRKKLEAQEDFSGTWVLWAHVEANGGFERKEYRGEEAQAHIAVSYHLELTTKRTGQEDRVRHCRYQDGGLPDPFPGKFWVPKTPKEFERLREGPAFERMVEEWVDGPDGASSFRGNRARKKVTVENPQVWVEATVETVATLRTLQAKLAAMGEKVNEALQRKNFETTLERIRIGGTMLALPSSSITTPET